MEERCTDSELPNKKQRIDWYGIGLKIVSVVCTVLFSWAILFFYICRFLDDMTYLWETPEERKRRHERE